MSKKHKKMYMNLVTDGKNWVRQPSVINIGDFALCQKGDLGLVLWYSICVEKRTNKKYILYHGINLTGRKIGLNWQSRNPKKVSQSYVRKMFSPKVVVEK